MEISTIGLDLAKNVFQVHGIDAEGEVIVRKALQRAQVLPSFAELPPCLVGMEACGTAHHRARDLLVKQRTQLVNMVRGLLAEFGVDIPQGVHRALEMARTIVDGEAPSVQPAAAKIVGRLSQQALDTHAQCREIDLDLLAWQKTTIRLAVSCRSPASVQSAQRRLPRRSPTRASSVQGGSSPRGWA